jgi:hypothetical protein
LEVTVDVTSVAEAMERDIARLKAARPNLGSRIERAEHILVTQLSTANGSRPVKVRCHADGSRSYLVSPESWSCECPDHRRRQEACKHALACWVLERAFGSSPLTVGASDECSGCGDRFAGRELVELHEDNHDDLTHFHGDFLCRGCADGVCF